jgi:hypothetical protein
LDYVHDNYWNNNKNRCVLYFLGMMYMIYYWNWSITTIAWYTYSKGMKYTTMELIYKRVGSIVKTSINLSDCFYRYSSTKRFFFHLSLILFSFFIIIHFYTLYPQDMHLIMMINFPHIKSEYILSHRINYTLLYIEWILRLRIIF